MIRSPGAKCLTGSFIIVKACCFLELKTFDIYGIIDFNGWTEKPYNWIWNKKAVLAVFQSTLRIDFNKYGIHNIML